MKRLSCAAAFAVCLASSACTVNDRAQEPADDDVVDYGMSNTRDEDDAAMTGFAAYRVERATDVLSYKASIPQEAMAIPSLNARLTGEIDQAIEDYEGKASEMQAESPDVFQPWSYQAEWTVAFKNPEFLSLVGRIYEYSGGAHPNMSYETVLWDRRADRAVDLAAFFEDKRAGLRAVSEAAKSAFFAEIEHRGAAPEPDPDADSDENPVPGWALDGLKPSPDNFDAFVLIPSPTSEPAGGEAFDGAAIDGGKAGGVLALFGPYELGPYVWGGFELFVPASAFRDHLTPRFAKLFGEDAAPPTTQR